MYAILISAFNTLLGFVLRTVVFKFVIFTSIYVCFTELLPVVVSAIFPTGDAGLSGYLSALPSGVWYFLDIFQISFGLPLVLAAFCSRFIIRRIPGLN